MLLKSCKKQKDGYFEVCDEFVMSQGVQNLFLCQSSVNLILLTCQILRIALAYSFIFILPEYKKKLKKLKKKKKKRLIFKFKRRSDTYFFFLFWTLRFLQKPEVFFNFFFDVHIFFVWRNFFNFQEKRKWTKKHEFQCYTCKKNHENNAEKQREKV